MVDMNNYEEYMILFADGELNATEQQELLAFVKLHPELEAELNAYAGAKLVPDKALGFGDKKALLQIPFESKAESEKPKEQNGKKGIIINFKQLAVYSAAAGMAALLITILVKWNGQKEVIVVQKNPVKQERSIDTIQKENTVKEPVLVQQNEPEEKEEKKNLKNIVTKKQELRYTNRSQEKKVAEPEQQPENKKEEITRLDITPTKNLENDRTQEKINEVKVAEVATSTEPKKSILERIPLEEEKKEGIKDLASSVTNSVHHLKSLTNNLKQTALVVKVGKKKLKFNL